MQRVAVIGPAGAGKSRLARELGAKLGVPVLHLDTLFWKPGWVRTPHDEWVAAQRRELAGESWIVDAQYDDMLPEWIDAADTIVFLDASPLQCFWRVSRRRLQPQPGTGVPAGSEPGPVHQALRKFLRNQWEYRRNVRPELVADLARRRNGQRVVVLRNETDLRNFLSGT
jgi:adenylate kinase family enzyme